MAPESVRALASSSRSGAGRSAPATAAASRRISYFMLFRLGLLAMFTVLAGAFTLASDQAVTTNTSIGVWATLVLGYAVTIAYARWLPRARDLPRFAWTQTVIDIVLAAVAVTLTGGIDSGLVTLYPLAVLGAAIMGGRRHTWGAVIACTVVFGLMSILEQSGVLTPQTMGGVWLPLPRREATLLVLRTLGALLGVGLLSSYLAVQLQASVSQVGNLRALNDNIVRSVNSGLLTVDTYDRLLFFNPAAREMLMLQDEDIGAPLSSVLPELASASRGDTARIDLAHRLIDGRTIRIGLTRVPLLDAQGIEIGRVINFQDVTRLHELGERVRRNDRLAALGGMAASVAHEIRNPLAAISGSAELLSTAQLDEEDARLLAIIRRESSRLSDMIRDLLAFTRPRAPEPVRLDLARAVRETTEAFAADPNNVGVTVVFDGSPGAEVDVDPVQLGQVLWNLMRNAAEAMHGRGELRVEVFADGPEVKIAVSDDGVGISGERLESIFDPFFTTKEHGTGFGLAIVHRIVEDNGGSIRVASAVGAGSTFTVVFPRAQDRVEVSSSGELSLD
ncbi:MAG: PAS domain-containing protein [Nannocystaceae bacterium]|nr:PAS domain-containing protein [Deltaproteobacteria bacterium]MBP7285770.1 PAS domain-containing protein [Nannocystaceae bacterium]